MSTSHTHKKKRFDFFTEYHKEKTIKTISYLSSGFFAVFLAFSFVSSYQGNWDLRGLMASVAQLTPSTQYDADVILSWSWNTFTLTFGSDAARVDSIHFVLFWDPERIRSITPQTPQVSLVSLGWGMYQWRIAIDWRNILPGTILAKFSIDRDAGSPLNMIDTQFLSEWSLYSLTNKTEF